MNPSALPWHFPLPRPHTGIPLGNGSQGLLVWGDETLLLTVARAGFWDHRGGDPFSTGITYREVRRLVEAGDEAGLVARFKGSRYPYQIGGGRLEIAFPDGFRPATGRLEADRIVVTLEDASGAQREIGIYQAMDEELLWLEGVPQEAAVTLRPSWDWVGAKLAADGVCEPERWAEPAAGGFIQRLPEDEPLQVRWQWTQGRLALQTARGEAALPPVTPEALDAARQRTVAWWQEYWKSVPRVTLPDATLQNALALGLSKQAGITPPQGVAATLQGPWMEDDALPPWSNDYHFNINVQLVYGPALPTNRPGHLAPLWEMIREWLPTLRRNGERFFERPGALMLPHAVDDRCQVIGHFWAGTIDHACTAWVAQMAWQHYRYTLDEDFLRELAWPLLVGAFEGYFAMMEKTPEGRYSLPLSVSPEFNASSLGACGRDASFQLAAAHRSILALRAAAAVLGEAEDPRWADVAAHLPPYTLCAPEGSRGKFNPIGLWEGQPLSESHRHHSHLASIWPFQTVNPFAPEHERIIGDSLLQWTTQGAGKWTGWCIPWASILCTRCGLPDAALLWLQWGLALFTNEGRGSLHDVAFAGAGGLGQFELGNTGFRRPETFTEIMQMDAGMAAVTAILEMLVYCRDEEIVVMERLPRQWHELRFEGIRTEGAFLVSGEVARRRVVSIRVHSEKGGRLRLRHSMRGTYATAHGTGALEGFLFECDLAAGEEVTLSARP